MSIRALLAAAALLFAGGCAGEERGPVRVAGIGAPPALANPNLAALDPPSALLLQATAQGLVRFDAAGEIEPALAQSWIVSDDGLRYTFRIRRTDWIGGGRVTAAQVVGRLRAALTNASRNPLKPIFGLVREIVPMTDEVLEITLRAPRANFLQLLAQPELAIVMGSRGTGPYGAAPQPDGSLLLTPPPGEEQEEEEPAEPAIALRGERAAQAVARFAAGGADLVTGGTAGDLPIARAAAPPGAALQFDPVGGLFGILFQSERGILAVPEVRRALAMAVDRDGIVAALGVPGLGARATLLPQGLDEVPGPAAPDWGAAPLAARRQEAARTLAAALAAQPALRLRIVMPEGPGYRLIFAYLRRDWRAVGVEAERVARDGDADLRFVDSVAPAIMAAWYLRNFTCDRVRPCSPEADEALAAARETQNVVERRALLAKADRLMTDAMLFVPIASPVRWSLVSPRLTGFRRNVFGRHDPGELIANER
ncbi:MAG: peptide/nickel transport system substrate-binding protein [Sphingomonadales bacterium]|nr:peptide/nickel transport system substrate-binding protein [Sphingomonadales bacterium]